MRLGIHVSIAGGMAKMAETAVSLGCESVQIFSRSPRGGKAKDLSLPDVEKMKSIMAEHDIWPLVVHIPYFVNLASSSPDTRSYSIDVLVEDLQRTETLGGRYLVTHIGHKRKDEPPESPDALAGVYSSIEEALKRYTGPVKILLENTVGMGQEIGFSFEALGALVKSFPEERLGACLDTAHAFGAGYDWTAPEGVRKILTDFDDRVGLSRLGAMHLNDSKGTLGARMDRHAHIGQGNLGEDVFRAILHCPLLPPDLPGLLETPIDDHGDDLCNMKKIRALRG
ncbi:MAG TPA: deoxyribonuclease IV [Firmicutes bacterium]|nr:deoxyribonuclease IV [Candidatus Fermentithermobacillaceae bacterium]